jgi:integrase/recombinase XerC
MMSKKFFIVDALAKLGADIKAMRNGSATPDRDPVEIYLSSVAPGSRRTQIASLNRVAHVLGIDARDAKGKDVSFTAMNWGALRFQHTNAIRQGLLNHVEAGDYGLAGANGAISALRCVLKAAWRLGQMSADEYQKAVDVQDISGSRVKAGRHISRVELKAIFDVCVNDPSPIGVRDGAIVAVLRVTGMRRAELVGLDLADYDRASGTLVIRHGKGNKQRLAYVDNGTAAALGDWLAIRGDEAGPLFLAIRKGGAMVYGKRMSTQAIWYILHRRTEEAGVKDVSPHDFRRTFVGDLLDAGADISTVQKLAGHASANGTTNYDRRREPTRRRAASLLHVPYKRKIKRGRSGHVR